MQRLLQLNTPVPIFSLPRLNGNLFSLPEKPNKVIFIQFWSADCSWCQKLEPELIQLHAEWEDDVEILLIASNRYETKPMLRRFKAARNNNMPLILFDEYQDVANLFNAQVTPHCFVIDSDRILRYQGAFNDMTFRQPESKRNFVREAVYALLKGNRPLIEQTNPYGCALIRN